MNTKATQALPAGYAQTETIDLVHNKRQLVLVNVLACALALLTALLGQLIQPLNFSVWSLSTVLLVAGAICLYVVGHEAVHGLLMWRYGHKKPRFGFSLMYAYAGSDLFFAQKPYLVIALAPLIAWGVGLTALALLTPASWFWPVWVVQVMNVSGAAGDLYVFARVSCMPSTVLVQDTGTAMSVYDRA